MSNINDLRKLARQAYLSKREETKLLLLKQEIVEFNNDIKLHGWSNLSKKEQNEYKYKKEILDIVSRRRDLSDQIQNELSANYTLPEDYFTAEGKVDKQKKLALLTDNKQSETFHAVTTVGDDKLEENFEDPDSLNLPGSEKYEFVFDDSQNINFVTNEEEDQLEDQDEIITEEEARNQQEMAEEMAKQSHRKTIEETKKSLPVYQYKDQIIEAVNKYQVLIFVGETGSGKTTQLPQYLYEAGFCKSPDGLSPPKKIAITQPRRVAATSVAARVADEMGVRLGAEVGYTIRFDDKSSDKTVVKYVTDGMLLREFLTDPELSTYSAIIIDEAHERTISTDILLGLLKDILKVNKSLKLIISSATVNAKKFSEFFDDAPVFSVPGRRYPVEIYYTEQPEANYLFAAVTTIFQIHLSQPTPGDILVFLTGQDEIETLAEIVEDTAAKLGSKIAPVVVAPIYANLPIEMQAKIFEPAPEGARKVVLATNIAETSITIDGIKYVIDPGFVKEKVYNSATGMESLVVVPCSQASAQQRAGRAGRVGPGKCFRLYTKWSFKNELPKQPTAEILRSNLSSVVLLLLSLGIYDILSFEFLDRPADGLIIKALELLYALGCMNSQGELTRLGKAMAEFPIEPSFCKTLITSNELGCLEEMLTIVAMLSEASSLFYLPKNHKKEAEKAKDGFNRKFRFQGDHFVYLEVWEQWVQSGFSYQWCRDNYIQSKSLNRVRNVRNQLERLCERNEYFLSQEKKKDSNAEDAQTKLILNIKRAIVSGFFANTCKLTKSGTSYRNIKKQQEVFIHPSLVMFRKKPPVKMLLYNELVLTSKEYMRNVIALDDEKVLKEYAAHYFDVKELEGMRRK